MATNQLTPEDILRRALHQIISVISDVEERAKSIRTIADPIGGDARVRALVDIADDALSRIDEIAMTALPEASRAGVRDALMNERDNIRRAMGDTRDADYADHLEERLRTIEAALAEVAP